ncbi:MAG: aspartate/glutamate racemase family protein [Opitutaceae bacterium]
MSKRIGLVHATLAAVQPAIFAFRTHAPDAVLVHFLDEGLLPMVEREGLTPRAVAELERLVTRAFDSGVEGVLLTCSAYSPAAPAIQKRFSLPVVSIDEAMLRRALEHGSRIGVVATVARAAPATAALLRNYAAGISRNVTVLESVAPEAFAALQQGDGAAHDRLIRDYIAALLPACDVIVLAQISMARALDGAPIYHKPVLASVDTGVRATLARLRSNECSS